MTAYSSMAVKNYTKTILIRARDGKARSWALRASESGKRLSTWIRESLNERAGYKPDGLSSESISPEPEVGPEPVIEPEVGESTSESERPVDEGTQGSPVGVGASLITDDEMRVILDDVLGRG